MNIMITGCAGFIGSHAVDYFLAKGHTVIGVDRFTYAGTVENIKHQYDNPNFVVHNSDICDREKMLEICNYREIDWIVNFAAETHVDNSINSAVPFLHSNINGVYSLLEVCRETKCKMLQISTDEVYGSIKEGSFSERDILDPRNPYSATKAAAEHLVTSFFNTYGVQYKIVRMSNNFGPRQHKEKFIPTILKNLKDNKKVPVYGDGKNIRDWFYVKDCVKCIAEVLENGKLNEIYNLSFNNEMENIEIVNLILDVLQKSPADSIEFVEDRLGHDFRYSIDSEKFLSLTNIKATDFKKALLETVEDFT